MESNVVINTENYFSSWIPSLGMRNFYEEYRGNGLNLPKKKKKKNYFNYGLKNSFHLDYLRRE